MYYMGCIKYNMETKEYLCYANVAYEWLETALSYAMGE